MKYQSHIVVIFGLIPIYPAIGNRAFPSGKVSLNGVGNKRRPDCVWVISEFPVTNGAVLRGVVTCGVAATLAPFISGSKVTA